MKKLSKIVMVLSKIFEIEHLELYLNYIRACLIPCISRILNRLFALKFYILPCKPAAIISDCLSAF